MKKYFLALLFIACCTTDVYGAYFFVDGSHEMINGYLYNYSVYLTTEANTITAAQTVLNFDKSKIRAYSINTIGSRCSFWAPADPTLGFGNQSTPYFYNENKLVISCGFSNPGYLSNSGQADLVAKIQMAPEASVSGTSSLTFSDTMFRYIGNTIVPGANRGLDIGIYASTESAYPSPTPYPTPTTGSSTTTTISSSSLNLVNIATGSSRTSTSRTTTTTQLPTTNVTILPNQINQQSVMDNTIPAPPDLTPRPSTVPFNQQVDQAAEKQNDPLGEVLSVQSLKELLLPGKSKADQTVVLVNLITALAFISILTILVWRLIVVSRMNSIKYKHLKEILGGELSALESKLSSEVGEENRETLNSQIEDIRKKLGTD
jgi:hypothetical protein